jgi:hypothetical protein
MSFSIDQVVEILRAPHSSPIRRTHRGRTLWALLQNVRTTGQEVKAT